MFRLVSFIAVIAIAVGTAIVGWRTIAGDGPPSTGPGDDTPRAAITLSTFFGELLPGLRAAASAYEQSEGVRVHVQGMPYASYEMWLRTQLLSRRPPEIVLIEGTTLPWFYGQAGMLVEFSDAVQAPNPFAPQYDRWADSIRQPYIQFCRDATGDLWCMPLTEYGVGFFYNKTIYDRLGLTPPDRWADLVDNFRRLHDAHETAMVTAIGPDDAQTIWIAAIIEEWLTRKHIPSVNVTHAPGWVFDAQDPMCTLDERIDLDERIIAFERGIIDPARAEEYAELLRLVREAAQYWRIEYAGLDVRELERIFATGRSAHMMNGTWYLPLVEHHMNIMQEVSPDHVFEWSTFPFPVLDDRTSRLETCGGANQNAGMRACLIIPKQPIAPKQQQHALRFCQFLASPAGMRKLMRNGGVYDIPAVKGVEPLDEARPLLSKQQYAYLPVSALPGYDSQAIAEFWTMWQNWFGGRWTDRELLDHVSQLHRASLLRLYRRFRDKIDHDLIRRELGGKLPAWLEE